MITLRQRAREYLAMRRALGFTLSTWGAKLMSFISYLESTGATVITTDAAVTWATSTPRASTDAVHWSRRLDVARIFARHLKTLDAATEVPPEASCPTITGGSHRICTHPRRSPRCWPRPGG